MIHIVMVDVFHIINTLNIYLVLLTNNNYIYFITDIIEILM